MELRYDLFFELQKSAVRFLQISPKELAGRQSVLSRFRGVSIHWGLRRNLKRKCCLRENLACPFIIDGLLIKFATGWVQCCKRLNQALRRRIEGESAIRSSR